MTFERLKSFKIAPGLERKRVKKDTKKLYEVIICKRDDAKIGNLIKELERHGIDVDRNKEATDYYIFKKLKWSQIEKIAKLEEVDQIWPDEEGHTLLDDSVQTIKARAAWNTYGKKGKHVCWAVLDTGINREHPHFHRYTYKYLDFPVEETVVHRENFTDDEETVDRPYGKSGHGTHVAGIIAGASKGKVKVKREKNLPAEERELELWGVAPKAKLIDLKVLDRSDATKTSWVIKALDWIRKKNAEYSEIAIHGANLSLGITFDRDSYGCGHSPVCDEVNRLVKSGVVVCVAAGNKGFAEIQVVKGGRVKKQPTYQDLSIEDPGNASEAITVGSTHKTKPHLYGTSYFSSKGPTGDGRLKPDLLAPGEKIISCKHNFQRGNSVIYTTMSGTSQAAPHVSGAIALLLSVKLEFKGYPTMVKEVLLKNCVDLERERYFQGNGLLDIFKAICSV
jgi:subtilisin family serine protease